jgi:PPOX class probable F420-dependent enzyme
VTRHAVDLSDPALVAFWRARHLCTVTTIRPDGGLHVTPMGIVLDPERGLAWGITSRRSLKARNLRGAGQIAVCQVDGRWWSSLAGRADVLDDPGVVRDAETRYAERYRTPRVNPERVAIRITVGRVLANLPRDSALDGVPDVGGEL